MKYWTLPVPRVMSVGESLIPVTARSIWLLTGTVPLPLLFVALGSGSAAEMLAVSVFAPAVPGVTTMVAV